MDVSRWIGEAVHPAAHDAKRASPQCQPATPPVRPPRFDRVRQQTRLVSGEARQGRRALGMFQPHSAPEPPRGRPDRLDLAQEDLNRAGPETERDAEPDASGTPITEGSELLSAPAGRPGLRKPGAVPGSRPRCSEDVTCHDVPRGRLRVLAGSRIGCVRRISRERRGTRGMRGEARVP